MLYLFKVNDLAKVKKRNVLKECFEDPTKN